MYLHTVFTRIRMWQFMLVIWTTMLYLLLGSLPSDKSTHTKKMILKIGCKRIYNICQIWRVIFNKYGSQHGAYCDQRRFLRWPWELWLLSIKFLWGSSVSTKRQCDKSIVDLNQKVYVLCMALPLTSHLVTLDHLVLCLSFPICPMKIIS